MVLYLLFKIVVIFANFIHLCLPSFPAIRSSTFSLMPSSCCQAFIMRNCSCLLSRLYNPNFFVLMIIHVFKTSNFTCKMLFNSFYFVNVGSILNYRSTHKTVYLKNKYFYIRFFLQRYQSYKLRGVETMRHTIILMCI